MILAAAVSLLGVMPAWALRPVQVYQVTVRGASAANVVSEGMRLVLVRATGRRDAAANPQLGAIIQDAAQYLKGSRSLPGGAIQVDFDGVRVAQAILAAGGALWDTTRPFTLVAINPPPSGAAAEALRVQLEQTAEERGLPISLVPLAVTDANGAALSDEAVLHSAQTLGGDAVLIGRADPTNAGQWQWHLVSSYTSEGWTGSSDAGINGAADSLASVAVQVSSKPLEQIEVQVSGVATLTAYARVEQLLRAVPGVQTSGLSAAQGDHATFAVGVRGGGPALLRALTGSQHLSGSGSGGGETQIQLTYMP
jgi:Uncharacterized protein conserved in bacteria (DUF2066)